MIAIKINDVLIEMSRLSKSRNRAHVDHKYSDGDPASHLSSAPNRSLKYIKPATEGRRL
jgi:hypothetical protein